VLASATTLTVQRITESGSADKFKNFEAQVHAITRVRHHGVLRLRGFYLGVDKKLLIHDHASFSPAADQGRGDHGATVLLKFFHV
jgi:hypothetical protein